jgi:hypothetical protein
MEKFLDTNYLNWLKKEQSNMNRSTEREKMNLVFPQRKAQAQELHWWILLNIPRRKTILVPYKTSRKLEKD